MHLELQWTVWMPLTLWAIHRAYNEASLRFGALAGVLLWLQMLSSVYYGAFLVVIGATLALLLAATEPRRARCGRPGRSVSARWSAAVLTAPYAIPYIYEHPRARAARSWRGRELQRAIRQLRRRHREQNWLWGWTSFEYPGNELHLFPGLAAIALAVHRVHQGSAAIARIYFAHARDRRCAVVRAVTGGSTAGCTRTSARCRVSVRRRGSPIFACCALAMLAGFGFQVAAADRRAGRGRRSRCSLRSSWSSASSTGRHR